MIELFDGEESYLSDEEFGMMVVESFESFVGTPYYRIVELFGDELDDRFEVGENLTDSDIDDLLELGVEIFCKEPA